MLLIGHRGAGKSTLLRRLAGYAPAARCLDLDDELARQHGASTRELFERLGEAEFRRRETRLLHALLAEASQPETPLVIAVGAGFAGELPALAARDGELRVVWVARASDERGRIFLDRPRLDPELDPLAEFHHRRTQRTPRYRALATDCWLLPEGAEAGSDEEAAYFLDRLRTVGGVLTLVPESARPERLAPYLARRVAWGVDAIELRDDLLDEGQLRAALACVPREQRLVSFRSRARLASSLALLLEHGTARWDWPVELGECPRELRQTGGGIASLHGRSPDEPLANAIRRLESHAEHCGAGLRKLAVPIRHLGELAAGHAWSLAEPRRNVFLPMDPVAGRFAWYRLWRGAGLPLNFFREVPVEPQAAAPAPDQPTLCEWLLRKRLPAPTERPPPFAAVLGDPVSHSRTPVEQGAFFAARGMPTLRIAITEADLASCDPLAGLAALGLRAAAVTSPHKAAVLGWGGAVAPRPLAGESAVNTLAYDSAEGRYLATSTDEEGLRAAWLALQAELPTPRPTIAIWGGGGLQPVLESGFAGTGARYFSARSGASRSPQNDDGGADDAFRPDVVVWAVGRKRHAAWPPSGWRPAWVLDLDYGEDSPGREYALRCGAKHRDGLLMFRAQAAAQRRFFEQIFSQRSTQPEGAGGDNPA